MWCLSEARCQRLELTASDSPVPSTVSPCCLAPSAWFSCPRKRIAAFPSSFRFVSLPEPAVSPACLLSWSCPRPCRRLKASASCDHREPSARLFARQAARSLSGPISLIFLHATTQAGHWLCWMRLLRLPVIPPLRLAPATGGLWDELVLLPPNTVKRLASPKTAARPPSLTRPVLKLLLPRPKTSTKFMRVRAPSTAFRASRSCPARARDCFRSSMSRVRVLPNILASERRLRPGWRSKLSCRTQV